MRFAVNPKIKANVVHHRGRAFRKGIVYDSELEKIPQKRLNQMMKLTIGRCKYLSFAT